MKKIFIISLLCLSSLGLSAQDLNNSKIERSNRLSECSYYCQLHNQFHALDLFDQVARGLGSIQQYEEALNLLIPIFHLSEDSIQQELEENAQKNPDDLKERSHQFIELLELQTGMSLNNTSSESVKTFVASLLSNRYHGLAAIIAIDLGLKLYTNEVSKF